MFDIRWGASSDWEKVSGRNAITSELFYDGVIYGLGTYKGYGDNGKWKLLLWGYTFLGLSWAFGQGPVGRGPSKVQAVTSPVQGSQGHTGKGLT